MFYTSGSSSTPPASSSCSKLLRILQRNAGGFCARNVELLHLVLRFSVNLNCIQQLNLNYSSSFRIPEYSTLRSECIHSESGSLSPDDSHSSGRVATFFRQGLSFSDHSTFSLSLSLSISLHAASTPTSWRLTLC